jgi:hypothetical protein
MDDATEETESAIQADEDKARLPLIKEWFERTGTQSLHLTVSDEIIFASFDSCITDYVLTLLDRVESLDLLVCRRTLPRFTEFFPNAYSRLKRLRTVGDAFDPEDWAFLPHDAPLLTEFDSRSFQHPFSTLPLPFDRLTRLAVSYFPNPDHRPTTNNLLNILRSAPRLQSLRMPIAGGGPVDDPHQERVLLPDMHTLQLKFSALISPLFMFTQMPQLREIHFFEGPSPRIGAAADALTWFIRTHRPVARHIRKLEIEPSSSDIGFIQCLRELPALVHLVLLKPEQYDGTLAIPDILSALIPTALDNNAGLCRHLERLDIHSQSNPFDQLGHLHRLRSLMRNKANAAQRDPDTFSQLKSVTLPSPWRPAEGTPLAADLALCIEQTKVQLSFTGDEENSYTGWLKRGFWEDWWYNA